MINNIKKPKVKDLKTKENSHVHGKPLEKYVPGQPLKKKEIISKVQSNTSIVQLNIPIKRSYREELLFATKLGAYVALYAAAAMVILCAVKYLFWK